MPGKQVRDPVLKDITLMGHDEVLEACNKHREIHEGIGLSDELVNIVTFAYEQGWYAAYNLSLAKKTLVKEDEP